MKTNSFAFSSVLIATVAQWIIGTALFHTMPAAAASGWDDPCIEDSQSDECQYFTEFHAMQEQLWLTLWGMPYVHGMSTLTIGTSTVPGIEIYDVDVWIDRNMDHFVTSGTFEASVVLHVSSESVQKADPIDGGITTIELSAEIVAGILVGVTGSEIAVVGTITKSESVDELNQHQTIRHLWVMDVAASLEEAVQRANSAGRFTEALLAAEEAELDLLELITLDELLRGEAEPPTPIGGVVQECFDICNTLFGPNSGCIFPNCNDAWVSCIFGCGIAVDPNLDCSTCEQTPEAWACEMRCNWLDNEILLCQAEANACVQQAVDACNACWQAVLWINRLTYIPGVIWIHDTILVTRRSNGPDCNIICNGLYSICENDFHECLFGGDGDDVE